MGTCKEPKFVSHVLDAGKFEFKVLVDAVSGEGLRTAECSHGRPQEGTQTMFPEASSIGAPPTLEGGALLASSPLRGSVSSHCYINH